MGRKLVLKNVIFSGGTRLIILALGILIPRLMITTFGSEINGLISTVGQIFAYLALLEAGIGMSTVNALYAPLSSNDRNQINEVMSEARHYFRKVSLFYGLCILLFSVIYPFVANTELDRFLVFEIIILQGASNFINYYFCAVYSQLLIADGRKYVTENIYFLSYVLNTAGKILFIYLGFDVVFVQAIGLLVTVVSVLGTWMYVRKRYDWLDIGAPRSKKYLKERRAFIVHEFSTVIFNNTDVIIISAFCGFATASVYTVYSMIYTSLNSLLTTVNSGLGFVIGQNLDKGKEYLRRIYDTYNSIFMAVLFTVFTVAAILTKPFIALYTSGVTDIDYQMEGLVFLFVLINLLSGIRSVGSRLITVGGHADKTKIRSLIEAGINLLSSLILAYFFDIYGVLLGTVLALLYRSNDIIIYANVKILERTPIHEYIGVFANGVVFWGIYFLSDLLLPNISSYGIFFLVAGILCMISAVLYFLVALLTNFTIYRGYLGGLKRKLLRSK